MPSSDIGFNISLIGSFLTRLSFLNVVSNLYVCSHMMHNWRLKELSLVIESLKSQSIKMKTTEENITIELTPFQALAIASMLTMIDYRSVGFMKELTHEYNDLISEKLTKQQYDDAYAELQVKILCNNN